MSDVLTTAGEVIDVLGGPAKVASAMGVSKQTVSLWRSNGKFPAHVYFPLNDFLESVGLQASADLLGKHRRPYGTSKKEPKS